MISRQVLSERPATSAEIERLLYYMPTVSKQSANEWAKCFALSIMRQSRQRAWEPSVKQLGTMRGLVDDLFSQGAGDCEVLE